MKSKFYKIIEGVFEPATKEDLYDRKKGEFKIQMDELNRKFGPLKVGDYVTPLETSISIKPQKIGTKTNWKYEYDILS